MSASHTFERYNQPRSRQAEIERHVLEAAKSFRHAMAIRCRPSVVLRPALTQHEGPGGLFWLAQYGEVFASGETPDAAYLEFDRTWVGAE